jgi:hypothetical protein
MRHILLVLAIVGAALSGWVPAVAATLDAGHAAGMHAMHRMPVEDDGSEHDKAKTPAAHPIACSACFATQAEWPEPMSRPSDVSGHVATVVARLAGLAVPPLDPPPRS